MKRKRTMLITGSTEGLGRGVAERLAGPDVALIIHGRDAERGAAVVETVRRAGSDARFFAADLASLKEVRRLVGAITAEYEALDVIINNAGYARFSGPREESADGVEMHLAINYVAPRVLTQELLPVIGVDGMAQVINVASVGQQPIDFDDLMVERDYDGRLACARSKLAEVMLAFDFAAALDPERIHVNALHPATFMDTPTLRANDLKPVSSLESGIEAVLALIGRVDRTGISGYFFDGRQEASAHAQAYDMKARRRLDEAGLRLAGL